MNPGIKHQASGIRPQASGIKHQASGVRSHRVRRRPTGGRTGWKVIVAAWMAGLVALHVARGQPDDAWTAPDAGDASSHADDDYPDVYINDSFEAVELLDTARRLGERRRWDQAARLLDPMSQPHAAAQGTRPGPRAR